jgi:hypothetical protein
LISVGIWFVRLAGQPILEDDVADLFDLIRLGLAAAGLEIQDFFDSRAAENEVIAANSLLKAQSPQERPQVIETDIRIRIALKHAAQRLVSFGHGFLAPRQCFPAFGEL